jgi:hypothetical protein
VRLKRLEVKEEVGLGVAGFAGLLRVSLCMCVVCRVAMGAPRGELFREPGRLSQ